MERISLLALLTAHILSARRFVSNAIIGYSLVPRSFNSPPGTSCRIFRKPGVCFSDENCPEFQGLGEGNFDLVIVYLGGNDLAYLGEIEVYNHARAFMSRVREHDRIVRVCNTEHRFYPEWSNRAHLDNEYRRKRNVFNRKLKRYLNHQGHSMLDVGRPVFYHNRTDDGVRHISQIFLEQR